MSESPVLRQAVRADVPRIAALMRQSATGPARVRVRAMFVRDDWTGRGLGRAILARCERAARAEGFRSLVLMATLPGVPLYQSYGFREVGRTLMPLPDGVEPAGASMAYPLD